MINRAEMKEYFKRKQQLREEREARELRELNEYSRKLDERAATLVSQPIRDSAAMNTRSAVPKITPPPVAGFNVLSVTPETPRAQDQNTEQTSARPSSTSVATATESQETTKDTKRSKDLDDFDKNRGTTCKKLRNLYSPNRREVV